MQPIDIGDLSLAAENTSLQQQLFNAIRSKIVASLWPKGGKLPSTRKLAAELNISRNTAISVYEQLAAEGYLQAKAGSGYYVAVELPEQYLSQDVEPSGTKVTRPALDVNASFAPGVPDLQAFPAKKWGKLLQRHVSRTTLLGNQDLQGDSALRQALADYLSSSRSVKCDSEQVIITSGAQQALTISLMATLSANDSVLMESPGYIQMRKVIQLLGHRSQSVNIAPHTGIDLEAVFSSEASALYITPSNQYPMGTTINVEQRISLLEWAKKNQRWIIEDDYDSEFQFAHRPYPSLQGLSADVGAEQQVLYIGSLSKVMFNGLRLGYLVAPKGLVDRCLAVKDALSGDSPTHVQAALADFIVEGDFLRHIRKMRRLYKQKHERMLKAISTHFGDRVEVISQPAGLHVTLRWKGDISEVQWCEAAKERGIILRPLSMYETQDSSARSWQGAVLGFGNVSLDGIDEKIAELADIL
ncbi:MocR-like pyridoxine biosynthesis transcription factor PdxR [Vibrio paucivorans]|uniref:PLP-dependent aminotransferase family protein n=1 Tax=Vibrio paucivorans TaxID=2829489 RepID=A0A9X3CH81_9VIBR|nr:PLP-dependent aminotransferase family protein [Vibrio paucivorans]MCW8335838.1 PLP-dependent aminotransferase family protein [Vibrio paucivorans]